MVTGIKFEDDFFDQYNAELHRLGCGVRVVAPASQKADWLLVVDLDGKPIGELPVSVTPDALVAVMLLVEQSFEDGVETGRALERASS